MQNRQIMELIVLSRNCTLNLAMDRWLRRWHITPHFKSDKHNIVAARNAAVDEFLESNSDATHLIFMDSAIWPNASTDVLLRAEGDAIYLGYMTSGGAVAHVGDDIMGCSCCRISREALQAVKPPWFEYDYDAKGIEVLACECVTVSRKLRAAGFEIQMVGTVAHEVSMLAQPMPTGFRTTTREQYLNCGESERRDV